MISASAQVSEASTDILKWLGQRWTTEKLKILDTSLDHQLRFGRQERVCQFT